MPKSDPTRPAADKPRAAKKAAAKKPASKTPAASAGKPGATKSSAAPRKASPTKKPAARKPATKKVGTAAAVSPEQRYRMIAEAAYFLAENRGFAPGDVAADWRQAEAQIDRQFAQAAGPRRARASGLAQQVREAMAADPDSIAGRVQAITQQTLAGAVLDAKTLREVMDAVLEGAREGASVRMTQGAEALREAIGGLDQALAAAAEATQLAIQEASARGSEFSRNSLKSAIDELAALETLFIETLGKAARGATGVARASLQELAGHARSSGTVVGARIEAASSELARTIASNAREQMAAGRQTLRKEAALIAGMAAGLLEGITARWKSKAATRKQAPDTRD